MARRKLISSGSPFEPRIGFSRAVRVGPFVAVSDTAPIAADGSVAAIGKAGLTLDSVRWLVEIEADCIAEDA